MQCNYFTDNTKKNAAIKADIFMVIEIIPPDLTTLLSCSCHTGIQEYEPKKEEKSMYCFADFEDCPRLRTKINK
jgi:hypothetical protein